MSKRNNVYHEYRLWATGPTRLDDYITPVTDSRPMDELVANNRIPETDSIPAWKNIIIEADSRPVDEMATDYNKGRG